MVTQSRPGTTLTFLGGAREVTGSCYLLEHNRARVLMDCGMHQGGSSFKRLAKEKFAFRACDIDAVILSHAHLDHSGLLPMLVNCGFRGPIYCTPGTLSLIRILLLDALSLYLKDLEYENRRRDRAGHKYRVRPRYTESDVMTVLELCRPVEYAANTAVDRSISLRFHDAGHILGAAIVELTLTETNVDKTLVFSGDLGNPDTSLMAPPARLKHADVVLMESTYGNREHQDMRATLAQFEAILREVEERGGTVLIPSFAVGRTQELLFQLGRLYHKGILEHWAVFLDSPMASAVTSLYNYYRDILDPQDVALMEENGSFNLTRFLPNLTVTDDVASSRAINDVKHNAIIIAGSGMCTGGRILHHFKHRLWRDDTHVLIVGYQARGTLGRLLVDGTDRIRLFGQTIAVKAHIHTLGGFSAHAGQSQLLDWAGAFQDRPRFFLVHGEPDAMDILKSAMKQRLNIDAVIPEQGEAQVI